MCMCIGERMCIVCMCVCMCIGERMCIGMYVCMCIGEHVYRYVCVYVHR